MINLQILRRFYDTHYISIFGDKSKINLTHWIVGITYYPMVILAILSDSSNFRITGNNLIYCCVYNKKTGLNYLLGTQRTHLYDLGILEVIGILLFLWSWWHQHICTRILANLRKHKKGVYFMSLYEISSNFKKIV